MGTRQKATTALLAALIVGTQGFSPSYAAATGVVGDGTPASCTDAAFSAALASGSTVIFNCGDAPHTILLSNQKSISGAVEVDGNHLITLQAHGSRHFVVEAGGALTLERITLINGFSTNNGGSILVNGEASLTLKQATLSGNQTSDLASGGAIFSSGEVRIAESTLQNNSAGRNGGAIASEGQLSIENSRLIDNTVIYGEGMGGHLHNTGSATINTSTFSGGKAPLYGGAIFNSGSLALTQSALVHNSARHGGALYQMLGNATQASIDSSTLSGNSADVDGGAIHKSGALTLNFSTFADNRAGQSGDHLYMPEEQGATTYIGGTIFGPGSCEQNVVVSRGYNIDADGSCGLTDSTDQPGRDPMLEPLADNGGPGPTHLLQAGSPAIDTAGATCPAVDQRGISRPGDAACDIGAVEAISVPEGGAPIAGGGMSLTRQQLQDAARARLASASAITPSLQFENGALWFAQFDLTPPADVSGALPQAEWFLREYADLLGLAPGGEWQLVRHSPNGKHLIFRQLHEGLPVVPAEINIEVVNGHVLSLSGHYLTDVGLSATPSISATQALTTAQMLLNTDAAALGDIQLRFLNLRLLGESNAQTQLVWQVNLDTKPAPRTVFIDAHSGLLAFEQPRVDEGFDMDLQNGTGHSQWDLCFNPFVNPNIGRNFDTDATRVWDGFATTYNFWRSRFGRDSYDNDGEEIEANVHVGEAANNASYGYCDAFMFGNNMTTLEIVAHEFTHAIDANEGELVYSGQSGALDESFADIFAHFIDNSNWLIGDGTPAARSPNGGVAGCSGTPAFRDMSNPPCFGHPDRMSQYQNLPSNNDNGGVHTNSGISNKAAFLIIQGQNFNGHNVVGMGEAKALVLFQNVFVNRIGSNNTLWDLRNHMVAEARALRNANFLNTAAVCTVIEAYAAVELGAADRDCNGVEDDQQDDDKDGVPNAWPGSTGAPRDNCRTIFNPNQADYDGDGVGNTCDSDADNDGVSDYAFGKPNDNCYLRYNPDQKDRDGDGFGDACDDDRDDDGHPNAKDNCPNISNPDQADVDLDRVGNVCDDDGDNDLLCTYNGPKTGGVNGIPWQGCKPGAGRESEFVGTLLILRTIDNCALAFNPDQADGDGDSVGNACDRCPNVSDHDNGDPDGDGLGNPCDTDDDNDGVPDFNPDGSTLDNCRETPNPNQADLDKNGIGFVCDQAEQAAFLKQKNRRFEVAFDLGRIRVPVPDCPQCGVQPLPAKFRNIVNVTLPAGVRARIVDSNGFVVAKGSGDALTQTFRFSPPSFAGKSVRTAGGLQRASATSAATLLHDDTRYYLELIPGPEVDLTRAHEIIMTTSEEGLQPATVLLPFVMR